MAWSNLWRNKKRTVMVVCSLTLGLVLMSYFYASNASFDMDKYLMDLTVADFQIDDATNSAVSGYDPASQTIGDDLLSEIRNLDTLEAEGRLYSKGTSMPLSKEAQDNFTSYYTQDILDDYASFDPSFPMWKEVYDSALQGNAVPHTIYGADGLILTAAASENYILDGSFDAEQFATGDYALAIGPATEAGTGLPTYSVGEKVNVNGRTFTIMAVLSPLQPMVAGSTPVFDVPLVIPADVFTQMWPDSHLRKYYFNVEDSGIDEASELLTDYQQTKASGMSITSRQTMAKQYEDERRSSAVIGYAISMVIAPGRHPELYQQHGDRHHLPPPGICHDPEHRHDETAASEDAHLRGLILRRPHPGGLVHSEHLHRRRDRPRLNRRRIYHLPLYPAAPCHLHAGTAALRRPASVPLFPEPGKRQHRGTTAGGGVTGQNQNPAT